MESEARLKSHQAMVELGLRKQKKQREEKLDTIEQLKEQTQEQIEEVRRLNELDKENHIKMKEQQKRIQNNIRQMSLKMQAQRDSLRANPQALISMKHFDSAVNFDEYMLPELMASTVISKNSRINKHKGHMSVEVLKEREKA